ncbi:MAG: tail fiber domain-containing protein [Flavobacteriales bacterium]|nr:tail fiber domain-containing protein [Flavobacteriales bacterium]
MVNINSLFHFSGRLFKAMTVVIATAALASFPNEGLYAQVVGVGISDNATITPSPRSVLEVRSSSRGLLVPRLTAAQRTGFSFLNDGAPHASSDRGMLVYQTTSPGEGYWYWKNTVDGWVQVLDASSATGWLTGGNVAAGIDFLGTTNTQDLRIHTDNAIRYTVSTTGRLLAHQDGTAALPLITWDADPNMGIYRVGADILGFSTSGTEAMRIGTDGNVGIGVAALPAEKLDINGKIRMTNVADREIYVQDILGDGKSLTIKAGGFSGASGSGTAADGGNLVLQAGSGNSITSPTNGGDVVLRSGFNVSTNVNKGGDIVFETGQASSAFSEKMRIIESGVVRINSLGVGANYVVRADATGLLSAVDPATLGFGSVTSVGTGTGLTGGPITGSGTISIANDGVTTTQILNGTVANADLANMAAYSVKGNATSPAAAPTDIASSADHQVLRRNGTLGFGAIALNQAAAVTGTLPIANGGTNATAVPTAGALAYGTGTAYAFSTAGTAGNVLVSGGAGAPTWSTTAILMQDLTITNGLGPAATTYDGSVARTVKLGGPLSENTAITQGAFTFALSGNTISLNDGVLGAVTNIGTGAATGAVNIGGTGTQSINVGNAAGVKTVNLGSSTGASATNILSGSAAVNVNVSNNQPTNINTGTSSGSVLIGNAANNVGIGGAVNASYKVNITGKVKSTGINETSDERLKVNFASIDGALEKVLSMAGKYYDWRTLEFPNMGLSEGRQVGVIAQEMEKILPEVVTTGEDGYKAVEYGHIVPVLIEAIKEQQAIIAGQQEEITALKAMKDELNTLKVSVELLNEHLKTSQK